MAKKSPKAKGKTRRIKPRPKVGKVRSEMKRLSGDLTVIIRAKKDKTGDLSSGQLRKAQKTKDALDDALAIVTCIQSQAAY
jgi:hypothetical protein